jgi:hypothetical protein
MAKVVWFTYFLPPPSLFHCCCRFFLTLSRKAHNITLLIYRGCWIRLCWRCAEKLLWGNEIVGFRGLNFFNLKIILSEVKVNVQLLFTVRILTHILMLFFFFKNSLFWVFKFNLILYYLGTNGKKIPLQKKRENKRGVTPPNPKSRHH